jgi:hypothetical protein
MDPLRDAMLDGVFDDGLEDEHGDLCGEKFAGNIHGALEALDEADFLDFEILSRELQFFSERDLLPVGVFEDAAHEVAQFDDHGDGCVVSFFANEAGDGVECVEEEMRLDLTAERAELGLHKLLVEARGFGLLMREALSGVEQVTDEEDGAVEDEGREEAAVELV